MKKNHKGDIFLNANGSSGAKRLRDILKWKLQTASFKKIKKEKSDLRVIKHDKAPKIEENYICWLGHASFLIQINGKTVLTDPCLKAPLFFKRYTQIPFPIKSIKPDYILISHGHYDHLDAKTLKHFKNSTALVPLKMKPLIQKINNSLNILECDWHQTYNINEPFEITFLPARHWHKRTLTDTNRVLWGSFLIKTEKFSIYFAGDSAYDKHFKDISKLAKIDFALLPIGAYEPRWFMKNNHLNPNDSLKAFKDLNADTFIPMHYGTFSLSDESINEPKTKLKECIKNENVKFLDIGEILKIDSS